MEKKKRTKVMGKLKYFYQNNNEEIKRELKLKMNEYKMLNDSLVEIIEKDGDKRVIDVMREAINDTLEDINELQEQFEANEAENKRNPQKVKSYYDEIEKQSDKNSEIKMKFLNTETTFDSLPPANTVSIKDCDKKDIKNNLYDGIKKQHICKDYPINSQYDDVTRANRFLVKLETPFNIPEWYVRKVNFSPSNKELGIQVFDFVDKNTNKPIIEEIESIIANGTAFSITIEHLDPTGSVLYTEHYRECRVEELGRGDLYYEGDDFGTIDMIITYYDVSYEAAN